MTIAVKWRSRSIDLGITVAMGFLMMVVTVLVPDVFRVISIIRWVLTTALSFTAR